MLVLDSKAEAKIPPEFFRTQSNKQTNHGKHLPTTEYRPTKHQISFFNYVITPEITNKHKKPSFFQVLPNSDQVRRESPVTAARRNFPTITQAHAADHPYPGMRTPFMDGCGHWWILLLYSWMKSTSSVKNTQVERASNREFQPFFQKIESEVRDLEFCFSERERYENLHQF